MTPTEAVVRAAARHSLTLTDAAARDIADAALGAYDDTVTAAHTVATEIWTSLSDDSQACTRRLVVRRVTTEAAERGALPIELPRVEVRTIPPADFHTGGDGVEVRATMRVRYAREEAATTA
jgi:hypothetical protein